VMVIHPERERMCVAMTKGYAGKLLFVDLTTGTMAEETPDESFYRAYVGGTGLGARILMDRSKPGVDPLSPDNMLGFATGPLTATGAYGGGRFMVVTKSPLTGGWADSNCGGSWGPELKKAGYDGVFFTGAAEKPVCLVIDTGEARLISAESLWGKDTYETEDSLRAELGGEDGWEIACIGPAGERCSRLAGIVHDKGRIAARSGVGAVMGAKKLKAIAVRGKKGGRIEVADREGMREAQRKYLEIIKNSQFLSRLSAAGTAGDVSFLTSLGDCGIKNWTEAGTEAFPTVNKLDSPNMEGYKLKGYACNSCPVGCGSLLRIPQGPYASQDETHRPEYETLGALGPLCANDSAEAVIRANELCNRYGMDTISVGGTIAFAMECYENGLLSRDDTGGLELKWGNSEAVVALTEQICRGEGFGAVLADGSRRAAERIGKGSEKYAMQVAGRELPLHDPRFQPAQGTFYISDATPAQHNGFSAMSALEAGRSLGSHPLLQSDAKELFGEYEKKGELYARGAAFWQFLSSAGLCGFYMMFDTPPAVELLHAITGWDIDWDEIINTGKRILTLRQAFNVREGLKPEDYQLPKRFEQALAAGPAAGHENIPFYQLREYYFQALGWDPKTGRPLPETLADLGLDIKF